MWQVNPDDGASLLVHFLATGNFAKTPPPLVIRNTCLAQYPGAQALYHQHFLQVFVRIILGWNPTQQQPFARGGVFGHPRAVFGVNEEQARLSLHSHVLLWLHGHDQLLQRMQSPEARASLEAYINSVISVTLPWPSSNLAVAANTCQEEACEGKNSQLELDEEARKEARIVRKAPKQKDPQLLVCLDCKGRATPGQQRAHVLQAALAQAGYTGDGLPSTRDQLVQIKWNGMPHKHGAGEEKDAALRELLSCLIIGAQQSHQPCHRTTCLKSKKAQLSGCCRANLPACACATTKVEPIYACAAHPDALPLETDSEEGDGSCDTPKRCSECSACMPIVSLKISLRRDPTDAWVAAYNITMGECFGCNNNVQYCMARARACVCVCLCTF